MDLPPELLLRIITYVSNEWKNVRLPAVSQLAAPLPRVTALPLAPLLRVNSRLRALCLPILFHLLTVDPTGPLPPTHMSQHAQCICLNDFTYNTQWKIGEDFILRMPHLTQVIWHGPGTLNQVKLTHLLLLLTSPSLRSLTLNNVWLQPDESDPNPAASDLRALRIDFSRQVQGGGSTKPGFVEAHLACMHSIMGRLRPHLESLTLSGHSAKLSSLAAAAWPSLRAFSLTRGDAIFDVPWVQFLGQTPALSSLTVALESGRSPSIIPPDAAEALFLPCLRHLTISSPHPNDNVFYAAPPELQELSIRDSPRYYTVRTPNATDPVNEPILTCSDVLHIFSVLSVANLGALELVYLEDAEEFGMLRLLAESCPNLSLLELHRYPGTTSPEDAWYYDELTVPVDAIAESLAEFKFLRVLKLNLCFTDYDWTREADTLPPDYWAHLGEFLGEQAHTIASHVPWIDTLALLTWNRAACGMHWDTWSVRPGDEESPRLVHEDIYHEAFTCSECGYL